MGSYKKEFASGVIYTSVAKYTGVFIQIFISMILARLLDPPDFGILAIASVFISFVNLITDFGFGPAIIQVDNLKKKDLSALFSLTFLIGFIAAAILFSLAGAISNYYNNAEVKSVIHLLSLNTIFAALNIVPNALLLKAKKFKLIAIRTLCMQVFGGIIGVSLAFYGLGLYALVVQSIITAFGIFAFNYYQNPFNFFSHIYKTSIKKVFGFSIYQFFCSIVNYLTNNIDKPMIGKFLSLSSLGYYEKSYRLMQMPVDNLAYVITPVMQPMFGEFKDDMKQMFEKYSKLVKFLSVLAFPLSAMLYFSSYDLIHMFYGAKWGAAVIPFQNFSLCVGFMVMLSSTGAIYQASNNVKTMLMVVIVESIISLTCLFFSLQTGDVNYVALAISFGMLLRFISVYYILASKVFHVPFFRMLQFIMPGFLLGSVLCGLYYVLKLVTVDLYSFIRLLINVFILCVVVGSYLWRSKSLDIKSLLIKKTHDKIDCV